MRGTLEERLNDGPNSSEAGDIESSLYWSPITIDYCTIWNGGTFSIVFTFIMNTEEELPWKRPGRVQERTP
jgi:hypothetical protein